MLFSSVFTTFVAFSQWGNTIYNIMLKLRRGHRRSGCAGLVQEDDGERLRQCGRRGLHAARALRDGAVPHDLARTAEASPPLDEVSTPPLSGTAISLARIRPTSLDPLHWKNPDQFDPSRYQGAPTSHEIDEARMQQIGFARCPFDRTAFDVKDGRKASLNNSAFGTVYGVVARQAAARLRLCRLCARSGSAIAAAPASNSTIQVFEDFLQESVEGQDRLREARPCQGRAATDRAENGHR